MIVKGFVVTGLLLAYCNTFLAVTMPELPEQSKAPTLSDLEHDHVLLEQRIATNSPLPLNERNELCRLVVNSSTVTRSPKTPRRVRALSDSDLTVKALQQVDAQIHAQKNRFLATLTVFNITH